MSEKFWMVYGIGQREPRAKHATEQIALGEARRLASVHPGITFCVLEATHALVKQDVVVRRLGKSRASEADDDIPF